MRLGFIGPDVAADGLAACGLTVADAFQAIPTLERACKIQIMAQACEVIHGKGGNLDWPALLRKLDRVNPAYRN